MIPKQSKNFQIKVVQGAKHKFFKKKNQLSGDLGYLEAKSLELVSYGEFVKFPAAIEIAFFELKY